MTTKNKKSCKLLIYKTLAVYRVRESNPYFDSESVVT